MYASFYDALKNSVNGKVSCSITATVRTDRKSMLSRIILGKEKGGGADGMFLTFLRSSTLEILFLEPKCESNQVKLSDFWDTDTVTMQSHHHPPLQCVAITERFIENYTILHDLTILMQHNIVVLKIIPSFFHHL